MYYATGHDDPDHHEDQAPHHHDEEDHHHQSEHHEGEEHEVAGADRSASEMARDYSGAATYYYNYEYPYASYAYDPNYAEQLKSEQLDGASAHMYDTSAVGLSGLISKSSRRKRTECSYSVECKRAACFQFPGNPGYGRFCKTHAQPGMIEKRTYHCQHEDCNKQPNFNFEGEVSGKFCGKHRAPGMVNVNVKRCDVTGCSNVPIFFLPGTGEKKRFCKQHKTEDMVSMLKPCNFQGCNNQPSYNYRGSKNKLYCETHKMPEMVVVGRVFCAAPGCPRHGAFRPPPGGGGGDGGGGGGGPGGGGGGGPGGGGARADHRLYCPQHRQPGMVSAVGARAECEEPSCSAPPGWKWAGERRRRFCGRHKLAGMVYAKNHAACQTGGCEQPATHNFRGEPRAASCAAHRRPGMEFVRAADRRCLAPDCATIASFGYPGARTTGVFCAAHKEPGMVNRTLRVCQGGGGGGGGGEEGGAEGEGEGEPPCRKYALYNAPDQTRGRFCAAHKQKGMINVVHYKPCRTEGCREQALYGLGKTKIACAWHKRTGMVLMKRANSCKHGECLSVAAYSFPDCGPPLFCRRHQEEGMLPVHGPAADLRRRRWPCQYAGPGGEAAAGAGAAAPAEAAGAAPGGGGGGGVLPPAAAAGAGAGSVDGGGAAAAAVPPLPPGTTVSVAVDEDGAPVAVAVGPDGTARPVPVDEDGAPLLPPPAPPAPAPAPAPAAAAATAEPEEGAGGAGPAEEGGSTAAAAGEGSGGGENPQAAGDREGANPQSAGDGAPATPPAPAGEEEGGGGGQGLFALRRASGDGVEGEEGGGGAEGEAGAAAAGGEAAAAAGEGAAAAAAAGGAGARGPAACGRAAVYNWRGSAGPALCGGHAREGMVPVAPPDERAARARRAVCEDRGCDRVAWYNIPGEKEGKFCEWHKTPFHFPVNDVRTCKHKDCTKAARYNLPSSIGRAFCEEHKKEGMELVVSQSNRAKLSCRRYIHKEGAPRPTCGHRAPAAAAAAAAGEGEGEGEGRREGAGGCRAEAKYSAPDGNAPDRCFAHKPAGAVPWKPEISVPRCVAEGCRLRAAFGFPRMGLRYCAGHRPAGAVNLKARRKPRCEGAPRCTGRPLYQLPGEGPPTRCEAHRAPGMAAAAFASCPVAACPRRVCRNYPAGRAPEYCAHHALFLERVTPSEECEAPGCAEAPRYQHPLAGKAGWCAAHRAEGMVEVESAPCAAAGCSSPVPLNCPESERQTLCPRHQRAAFEARRRHACAAIGCKRFPTHQHPERGAAVACRRHAEEGMVKVETRHCLVEGCPRHCLYNLPPDAIEPYCPEHLAELDARERAGHTPACAAAGCDEGAALREPGEGPAAWCARHAGAGMVEVETRPCAAAGCGWRVCLNVMGPPPDRCARHRRPPAAEARPARAGGKAGCQARGCGRGRTHNYPGAGAAVVCYKHAATGMAKVPFKKCRQRGCHKRAPLNGSGGGGGAAAAGGGALLGAGEAAEEAVWCARHREPPPPERRCCKEDCREPAAFNFPGAARAAFCFAHRVPGTTRLLPDEDASDGDEDVLLAAGDALTALACHELVLPQKRRRSSVGRGRGRGRGGRGRGRGRGRGGAAGRGGGSGAPGAELSTPRAAELSKLGRPHRVPGDAKFFPCPHCGKEFWGRALGGHTTYCRNRTFYAQLAAAREEGGEAAADRLKARATATVGDQQRMVKAVLLEDAEGDAEDTITVTVLEEGRASENAEEGGKGAKVGSGDQVVAAPNQEVVPMEEEALGPAQQESLAPPAALGGKPQRHAWTCLACALENPAEVEACDACGTALPPAPVAPPPLPFPVAAPLDHAEAGFPHSATDVAPMDNPRAIAGQGTDEGVLVGDPQGPKPAAANLQGEAELSAAQPADEVETAAAPKAEVGTENGMDENDDVEAERALAEMQEVDESQGGGEGQRSVTNSVPSLVGEAATSSSL